METMELMEPMELMEHNGINGPSLTNEIIPPTIYKLFEQISVLLDFLVGNCLLIRQQHAY